MINLKSNQTGQLWNEYFKNRSLKNFNRLVEHYSIFVKRIAVNMAEKMNWQVQPDELASYGVDGLYKAIRSFEPEKNVKFEAYAGRRISGSMVDGLRKEDSVPRSVRIASDQFSDHKNRMEQSIGRRLGDVEFVNMLGMNESDYHKNFRKFLASNYSSIDNHGEETEEVKSDSNINLMDERTESPDTNVRRKEFFNQLLDKDFSQNERKIIFYYYYKKLTMDKIAFNIGLSESRVSQMHKKLLKKLKKKILKNHNISLFSSV